ncbi:hypothetical protein EQG41_03180 [Billgrantia azerbaijanica]|nr:hypothetical protein EQG41_03180 [Halomonas azerbaijanica]
MWLKLERWGIDVGMGNCVVRLVSGDVFIRIPKLGQMAWNQFGLAVDRWEDAKHDPVLNVP